MGIVRDVTVDQLTQAVGNIDTSTLAQDSTLQNVVTAIGNISGGNDPVTNTTVNSLCKDSTGQSIASAISGLGSAISPNVETYDMGSTVTLFKFGKLVIMELKNWLKVGDLTIPERFRPTNIFYFCAEERKSDNTNLGVQRFVVNTDGTCNTYDYQSTSKVIGSFTWFTS